MKYYRKKLSVYPVFEWLEVGILLCFAGGFLDAYTYVTRGGVFCNAQTSNLIFLTLNLASGNPAEAVRYLTSVLLFIAGVFFSELCLHLSRKKRDEFHGHSYVLLGEIAVLVLVGFLPSSVPDMFVNGLVSLAAAVQFDNFRKLEGKPFATAFCTGNMRSATEHAMHSVAEKDLAAFKVTGKYFLIIVSFLCGVLAGYYASRAAGGYAAFIPAALLAVVLICILTGNALQNRQRARQSTEQPTPDAVQAAEPTDNAAQPAEPTDNAAQSAETNNNAAQSAEPFCPDAVPASARQEGAEQKSAERKPETDNADAQTGIGEENPQ